MDKRDDPGAHVSIDHDGASLAAVPLKKARFSRKFQQQQETFREKQLKAREAREERRGELMPTHRHLIQLVSFDLEIDMNTVEEGVLDSPSYLELMNSFLTARGRGTLIFHYQEAEFPSIDSGRVAVNTPRESTIKRVMVSDGTNLPIQGQIVMCYRTKTNIDIDTRNILDEIFSICFGEISGDLAFTAIETLHNFITQINRHAVVKDNSWGDFVKQSYGMKVKSHFVSDYDAFTSFLSSAIGELKGRVLFTKDEKLDKLNFHSPQSLVDASNDPGTVAAIEATVFTWGKQIEMIITKSDLMRRESDLGPLAELTHWRRLLTAFTSIVEHIKGPKCSGMIEILHKANSKHLTKWKSLESKIVDYCSEARNNVKYLYSIERFLEPLYRGSPGEMSDCLPRLMHAIRMIYGTSRYYNTNEKITALFVKVTNQLVASCKRYLTNNDTVNIWQQPKLEMIHKMKVCIQLHKHYYQCYEETKEKIAASPDEKDIDCSTMYIFGKFETFTKRLDRLSDLLSTFIKYSVLRSSRIEGIEVFAKRFLDMEKSISNKEYDVLDHRKPYFDQDYQEIRRSIGDIEKDLRNFMNDHLSLTPDIHEALRILARFEKLNLPCLKIDGKYCEQLDRLMAEIDMVRFKYHEEKDEPPIPRYMPPVAGRIMWARYYLKRIEQPMAILKVKEGVLGVPKAKKVIKLYNAMAMVLVHYETLYHRAWCEETRKVRSRLLGPVLKLNPKTQKYEINFDRYVTEVIRETECMWKFGLEVPDAPQMLTMQRQQFFRTVEKIKLLLECYERLTLKTSVDNLLETAGIMAELGVKPKEAVTEGGIPELFEPLMANQLLSIERALQPGLSVICWLSTNLEEYHSSALKAICAVEDFLKEVKDIQDARIYGVMDQITTVDLIYLPSSEAYTVSELIKKNLKYRGKVKKDLEVKSQAAEKAAIELVNKFLEAIDLDVNEEAKYDWMNVEYDPKGMRRVYFSHECLTETETQLKLNVMHQCCMDLFLHYGQKNLEALVKATKLSLEKMRKRTSNIRIGRENEPMESEPFIRTELIFQIPSIVLKPTLDEIQLAMNHMITNSIEIHKGVICWGQKRKEDVTSEESDLSVNLSLKSSRAGSTLTTKTEMETDESSSYYRSVADHKETVRCVMMLQGLITSLRSDVDLLCKKYLAYSYLWAEDREDQVKKFVEGKPIVDFVLEEFRKYEDLVEEINSLPSSHTVGPLIIQTGEFKSALVQEVIAWKLLLGKYLSEYNHEVLNELHEFISEHTATLQKPIKDLEDVRVAMACLDEIRENHIRIDMAIGPLEEVYAVLNAFSIEIPQEDTERVDAIRYAFQKMVEQATLSQVELVEIQEPFKQELLNGVAQFKEDVEYFDRDFIENGPMVEGIPAREASDRVLMFQSRFDDLWQKYETYSGGEKLFGLEVNEYPILVQRKKEFNLLQKLYGLYNAVMRAIDGYYDIVWSEVDIAAINEELQDFQLRCRKLPKGMKDWPAYQDLKKKIDDFSETCPILELMANEAMKERHWKRIADVTHHDFDIDSEMFCLRDVMEAPLLKYKDEVEDICISATKEKDIEAKLKLVIADWSTVYLQFATFKTRGELLLKGQETGEIIAILEDSLMVLGSLLSNRYNTPFKKDIQLWVNNLSNTSEILENWMLVQNLWVYLEAVFVGGDIAKQLPAEAKRFQGIDKTWVRIMERAHEKPNVVDCCVGDETMGQLLPHLLEQLETCQKSLTGYLESKRLLFPRFFFISDPSLLEILGQASDSHSIQAHLLGLFDNLAEVEFHEKDYDRVIAVLSREKERIPLKKTVMCTGGVEFWLNSLLKSQQDSLHEVIRDMADSMSESDFSVLDMINTFPAQVGLLGVQMMWTKQAEDALAGARLDRTIMKTTNTKFLELLNLLIEQTTKDLTPFDRTKYETLVTIHVHQRDIFDDLYTMRIKSTQDFEWLKQARFYFDEDSDVTLVKITDVDFIYQNEFLGCTERLVITPLTDRCYITLAQAIGMSMGGAPAGPAGTGKTETTKDMGKALAKYVVVFNCSDQMDFRGLGRIYKGLAQSGSWGCFDEFNRIDLPVLSVAAQQISIVLNAKKEHKTSFLFSDGDNVSLNPEFGIFITMNPGYAGRQELPENLKVMFRTVAMMVPDRQIIMRVKLASCGFKENIHLARKFFTLYKLCEEQLSKQVHYDFGLRNILSVLRTLGAQKRARPGDTEETIVMRVLRDMNMSKLVDEDEPLFRSLIEDLFPGIRLTQASYDALQTAIDHQVKKAGLINHPNWNLKVIQLYETSLVRHGLMTMGPTGAGKTSCIHMLMKSLTEIGFPHKEMRMNPKAITAPQMFGRLDVATNDWTDGIFSTLWRRTLKVKKSDYVWLVLDGPVDAVWIENLNSVLDDNKTLTLANGDRIVMAPNSKILFEPDNVDNASPATVSRMGMVFMSSSVLNWSPIIKGWLKTRPNNEADILWNLFEKIFEDLHLFVKIKLNAKMNILESMYIRQCGDLLDGLIPSLDESGPIEANHLERLFLFVLMWSLGAVLELDGRVKLEEFIRTHPSKLDWPKVKQDEAIFEYMVGSGGQWEHWGAHVEDYIYPPDSVPEYSSILVPNVDNVRTAFLINTIAKQSKAVLLIGEQGTAKTVMLKSFMAGYDPEYHLHKSLNFSSATTPNMFQRIIESYVEKRVGTTFGPPAGRKMTILIDDINMPVVNEWGDQVTNEIVRQLIEAGGFYSLDKPGDFSNIVDVQFLAAMIHPGGGRNDIPPRLKRHFNIFNCTLPSNSSMDKIFGAISMGYFCPTRFNEEVVMLPIKIVPLTRILWQKVKVKMLPTPAKFHYIFNLRDLSRIWEGILYIKGEECRTAHDFLSLWKHECTRVIADRLTNEEDREWFERTLLNTAEDQLGDLFEHLPQEPTFFVDFLREPPEPTGEEEEEITLEPPKIYEEIPSFDFVRDKVLQYMATYNEFVRGANMDVVFFYDALVHLMKISRIIRTPRGNALLVGVGGSGKQSLTRLATFIAGYKVYQITLTRAYSVSNLMDDLKILYRVSGFEGNGISFIFTDNEIKDEAFLEYLNNVLSSGEVANLFAKDELDEILSELAPVMKKAQPKVSPSNDNIYSFFISQARTNLHVVLCFSPVGDKFRSRSLKFPGLISGCTMDWFSSWPKDALVAVSEHFLAEFPIVCNDNVKDQVIQFVGDIHNGVADKCESYFERFRRQTHVTPKSYLTFLDGYKKIYAARQEEISVLSDRMTVGLKKLQEAKESVDVLYVELKEKRVVIEESSKVVEKVLEVVTAKTEAAEAVKAEVEEVKNQALTLFNEIEVVKKNAEEKLIAALPALEAAEAALQTIKASDIATVRKLGKPPYLITLIMDAVLILFQKKLEPIKPDPERQFLIPSWNESLKVMNDTKFLSNLQNFPKDQINGETVDLMQPYLDYHLYTFESAKQACGNVAGLIQWTISMAIFYGINKEVLPLKADLAVQEAKLKRASIELEKAESILEEKNKELAIVKADYDAAMYDKKLLEDDAQKLQNKTDSAQKLLEGLSGERQRWTQQSHLFKSMTEQLVGDAILLTGFLSYLGPFNQEYRINLQKSWEQGIKERDIPMTDDLDIIDNLVDTATIGEWNLQGLPSDELSIQNGIIVTKGDRYPLLIDPQIQGKQWVLNKEKDNELTVTSLNNRYFRNHVEDCVSLGRPLLIEDVGEQLDPVLDNILEKNFIKSGLGLKVKVGDKEVDVMNGFCLYITTKLPNPSYTPEISARTSIIDFTVTLKGLEDQLLGRVILAEKKELEAERVNLMQDATANKRLMQDLEDELLFRLTSVEGSLVEDENLIQVLNKNKVIAMDVTEKLKNAASTSIKINNAREEFRRVANRGSVLYFLICEMSLVNCMYQTSLVQFLEIFDLSLQRSKKSPVALKRTGYIIETLTFEVFRYTSRSLYENHKFLFVLLMALKIDLLSGNISPQEFEIFIKGGAALDLNTCPENTSKWITDVTWLNLIQLSSLRLFEKVPEKVKSNERLWKVWYDKEAPEEEVIPDNYDQVMDVFQKTLFIRSWCPDRTTAQARKYVASSLGEKFAEPIILKLEEMVEESRPNTPLVCLLSMGSDPSPQIEGLAKKSAIVLQAVSMGQGQEIHARRLLSQLLVEGGWLLLQNCHLGLAYMHELVTVLYATESFHQDFRLWITTEVHPYFSISLLQCSIKYTNEPPQGIRAGLKRTYSGISQDMLDYTDYTHYRPMLYAVSFLHTVVQERRKFGPLGWNIPYEFNFADWYASVLFIQNHLDEIDPKRGVSWPTVRYMLGEVQYGGRVTDDYDKRLLNTFAKVWFGEHMFSEKFVFYKKYPIVVLSEIEQYMEAIENMPPSDPPQVYGLSSNADITYQTNFVNETLSTIVSIQPKETSVGGGESRESVVARAAQEMLDKLPKNYDPHHVKERLKIMGAMNSMNIFLRQEIDRMQRVISLVRATLQDLLLAIEGTIIMNENLRDALDNCYDARVPNSWKKGSWVSTSLGFWFTELLDRNQQFSSWIYEARPNVFWMTGFFNAQGFLTAMRQEVARAHKGWALDSVTLHNEVTKFHQREEVKAPPTEGVYVYGLYLDGAAWDRKNNRLMESIPKVLFVSMPVVHLYAINSTAPKDPKLYMSPVYKKPNRTDLTYVTPLWLTTVKPPEHWILRGVALLCDIK
ncbi:dynein axonemal heavy chain 8 [Ischnura elegans]|uniref:dynein axonemal heavy chain 8 n=1 Tax=Ischnura elegans TaxID=197161 RepID=UPI001ED8B009|nr:dynein axonemal heavy chain 8 [Ischnura elegans]